MAARSGAMKAFVFFLFSLSFFFFLHAYRVNGQGNVRVIVQIIISRYRYIL